MAGGQILDHILFYKFFGADLTRLLKIFWRRRTRPMGSRHSSGRKYSSCDASIRAESVHLPIAFRFIVLGLLLINRAGRAGSFTKVELFQKPEVGGWSSEIAGQSLVVKVQRREIVAGPVTTTCGPRTFNNSTGINRGGRELRGAKHGKGSRPRQPALPPACHCVVWAADLVSGAG
jgi:hypothetical protein